MDRAVYEKRMFLAGAIWNWAVAAIFFVLSVAMPALFIDFGMVIPNSMVWFHSLLGYVFIFGIALYVIHKNVQANRGLILICFIEKVFIFIVSLVYFVIGEAGLILLVVVIVDLVLGILFLDVLLH
nr:hypothetical protein [Candidatus Sigynarchaeota archaeon]